MILRDVDARLTEQGPNAPDHTRYIVVRKNQLSIAGLDVDVECTDPRKTRRHPRLCRAGNCYLLHSTTQPDFYGVRIVVRRSFRRREIYSAIFSNRASVDQIEPLLF